MRFRCFPRMRLWQPGIDQKRKTTKGAMTLVSVFLFFIFSTLGLSMLYFSQIYLKLSAYKRNSTLLDYASENGIKLGFNHLLNLLSQTITPSLLSPHETNELRKNTINKGSEIVEKLLGSPVAEIVVTLVGGAAQEQDPGDS